MSSPDFTKIDRWIEQAAMEIVLSEPGSDRSQFPIRDLLSSLAEKSQGLAELAQFQACAAFATEFVEEIMFSGRPFSATELGVLNGLAEQLAALRRDPALTFVPPAMEASGAEPVAAVAAETCAESDEQFAVINLGNDGDLLREFANESREHLENIEQGVLILEENPHDADTLNSIFRAFHTFKGGSGFLHLVPVNRLSHELENLLDLARQGRLPITSRAMNFILEGRDVLAAFLGELEDQLACRQPCQPIAVPAQALIARVRAFLENPAAEEAPVALGVGPADAPNSPAPPRASSTANVIKVDTQKLDSLVDLAGELVIAQSLVAQDPALLALASPQLTRNLAQLGRITKELQKTAMSLRMIPIRGSFQKMSRLVRDLTAQMSKKVDLRFIGEDTEMDRTIVEELSDPLMHMIRNSIDHGIETPAVREAAGKAACGTVCLSACHQGGNIVIEISDDGAGLNPDRILAKAIERGIVAADASLAEKDILQLIFAPGFSTAEKITDISGRGVGMDVVKRNITKLRGKIEIASTLGRGSSFKIFLPLTLAIIDGLVVRLGEQRYIIPTLSVRESFRPTREMISTIYGRGEVVNVRGRLRPLLRLYETFGVTPRTTDPTAALVIVVECGNEERCVLVDDLVGKQEVVIKSLGDQFRRNKALAGAAILGDGRVGLILDPRALVQLGFEQAAA